MFDLKTCFLQYLENCFELSEVGCQVFANNDQIIQIREGMLTQHFGK